MVSFRLVGARVPSSCASVHVAPGACFGHLPQMPMPMPIPGTYVGTVPRLQPAPTLFDLFFSVARLPRLSAFSALGLSKIFPTIPIATRLFFSNLHATSSRRRCCRSSPHPSHRDLSLVSRFSLRVENYVVRLASPQPVVVASRHSVRNWSSREDALLARSAFVSHSLVATR